MAIPTPRFVIFYNGAECQPEQRILRLSDAFERKTDEPELELAVTMYNISLGHNAELPGACQRLEGYAQYVQKVREFAKGMKFAEAVEAAVDYCIRNGILEEFLTQNRAEAIAVSIFEYDEEKHIRSEKEESYQEGVASGMKQGMKRGEERLSFLYRKLLEDDRLDDLMRCTQDEGYRELLYEEYHI